MDKLSEFLSELELSIENAAPGSITAEARFRELSWWDSLAALTTLAVVDGVYGKQISAAEIGQCETFEDIHKMVSA